MSTDIDMTPAQIRALKIYTHSANLHNDYKPKSFEQIAQQLRDEGFTASSSSVGRWANLQLVPLVLEDGLKSITSKIILIFR